MPDYRARVDAARVEVTTEPVWTFSTVQSDRLPALAWIATVRPSTVEVDCGRSVRVERDGVFEGTWAGDPDLASVVSATTVFGSGVIVVGDGLVVVGPSHSLEAVYTVERRDEVLVSNSLAGLLTRARLELDPGFLYPPILLQAADLKWFPQDTADGPLRGARVAIPTSGQPVSAYFYENVVIGLDLATSISAKPREPTFNSFADYRQRLFEATESVFANARPRTSVVALSSGYDSTATAAVAAQLGCRRAVTFSRAKPAADGRPMDDSGMAAAAALGLQLETFDRLAYLSRADLPEAEFLATGMSGEDVVITAFEAALAGSVFLTGYWAGHMWHKFTTPFGWQSAPVDVAGCSMTEFRLRTDFFHFPLPYFGAIQTPRMSSMALDPDMQPFTVGGGYDRPVARRLAEEAGIARGSFAISKRAANATLHRDGPAAFAPATLEVVNAFAAREGARLRFPARPAIGRRQRALIKLAHRLRARWLVSRLLDRRRSLVHFDPEPGSLLFRWAVSIVKPRYEALGATVEVDEQR